MSSFDEYLKESLEDKEFAEVYEETKAELDLSVALAQRRIALGLTQQQLAEIAGIKQPMLARIESGQMPKPATLQKLAKSLQAGIIFTGDSIMLCKAEYIAVGSLFGALAEKVFSRQEAKFPLGNVVDMQDFKNKRKRQPLTALTVQMEKYENIKSALG